VITSILKRDINGTNSTRSSQNVYRVKWTMSTIRGNRSKLLPLQYTHFNFQPLLTLQYTLSLGYFELHSVHKVQQIYVKSQHWWCASNFTLFHATPVCDCKYSTYLCV